MNGLDKFNYINKTFDCSIGINSLTILGHIINEKSNKGKNKITELRTILQRESQNS
jgi:hypothetical protein